MLNTFGIVLVSLTAAVLGRSYSGVQVEHAHLHSSSSSSNYPEVAEQIGGDKRSGGRQYEASSELVGLGAGGYYGGQRALYAPHAAVGYPGAYGAVSVAESPLEGYPVGYGGGSYLGKPQIHAAVAHSHPHGHDHGVVLGRGVVGHHHGLAPLGHRGYGANYKGWVPIARPAYHQHPKTAVYTDAPITPIVNEVLKHTAAKLSHGGSAYAYGGYGAPIAGYAAAGVPVKGYAHAHSAIPVSDYGHGLGHGHGHGHGLGHGIAVGGYGLGGGVAAGGYGLHQHVTKAVPVSGYGHSLGHAHAHHGVVANAAYGVPVSDGYAVSGVVKGAYAAPIDVPVAGYGVAGVSSAGLYGYGHRGVAALAYKKPVADISITPSISYGYSYKLVPESLHGHPYRGVSGGIGVPVAKEVAYAPTVPYGRGGYSGYPQAHY